MEDRVSIQEPLRAFVQDFHAAGFGVVRHAMEPGVADELRARLDRLLDPRPGSEDAPLQRIVPRIVERHEGFAAVATSHPLVATLTGIFGLVPQLVCSYGHEKPPHTRTHTASHSDVAHLPGVPHHLSLLMVKAMYALTAVRAGSGGTVICPRSHREPVTAGQEAMPGANGHYVALDPGDLLLFHANVRHTASDNSSPDARLSLWFVYALPWMRVFPGYEYSEDFLKAIQPRLASEPHLSWIYGLRDPYAT